MTDKQTTGEQMTIEQLADARGLSVESMMVTVRRKLGKGFAKTDELTDEQIAILTSGQRGTNKTDAQRQTIEIGKAPGRYEFKMVVRLVNENGQLDEQ